MEYENETLLATYLGGPGQSCNILVDIQYRYRQSSYSKQNLTTTANREFTQNQTPLAFEIHRIRT